MAPKGKAGAKAEPKAKGKAKAKAGADAAASVAMPRSEAGADSNANADYYVVINEAIATIKAHGIFENISEMDPMPIRGNKDSGHEAVFDKAAYQTAISETGLYKSSANIFWMDPLWTPHPTVPIRHAAVSELAKYYFKEPCPFPDHVVARIFDID